ncbi:MAG: transporter substrate-binding protein [Actinomycetia bacterium]|nr:transporter substrate-binding protein [Actinomycetes bacterium]
MFGTRKLGIVAVALSAALAACGGAASISASPGASTGKSAVDPKGVLKYGQDLTTAFSDNFDPGAISNSCAETELSLIYQAVTKTKDNVSIAPGVAQSWTVDNPLQITFKLAPGMKFSDGEPLDSNAVKLSLEHTAKSPYRTSLSVITAMDTPDATTLVMHLNKAQAGDVLWALSFLDGMVYAPNSIPTADKQPVGSGPFTLAKYDVGQLVSLRANPTSPVAKLYKLAGVDFVQVGSGPQALTALKSGQVDLIDVTPEAYPAAKADPSIGIVQGRSLDYALIQLRLNAAPFDNPKIRAALEYAVDRNTINKVVYGGQGEVADQLFPKGTSGYSKKLAGVYNYNPKKSKQMLKAAGFPNGVSFTMVTLGGQPTFERMAPLLQSQLAAGGFKVKLVRIQASAILQEFYLSKTANAIVSTNLTNGPALWNNSLNNYTPIGFIANALGSPASDIVSPLVAKADGGSFDPKIVGPPMQELSKTVMAQGLEVPIVFQPRVLAYKKARVGGKVKAPIGLCRSDLEGIYIKK